jgi:tetratricopeptide (TPR) repeat protein
MKPQWRAGRALGILLLLAVALLAANRIGDVDAWTHLNLGRLIWETRGLPASEVFAYPPPGPSGHQSAYTFWVLGLVSYAVYHMVGPYGLSLLKVAAACAAFALLYADARRPFARPAVAASVLAVAALICYPRFVLRPDLLLMVFLAFTVMSVGAYLYEGKRFVFALPAVTMLWANTHSSIPLVLGIFPAVLAGGAVDMALARRRGADAAQAPTPAQLKVLALVFLASVATSLINPSFVAPYLYATRVLSGRWEAEEILELRHPEGAALALAIALDVLILISFLLNRRRARAMDFLLVLPFALMPFGAVRFQFLAAVMGGPVVARNISGALEGRVAGPGPVRAGRALATLVIILAPLPALLGVAPFSDSYKRFGLGFDESLMPRGAVAFMERSGIEGRVFNTLHFGQYITWTGYPRRTVFIDGRMLLSQELLEKSRSFWSDGAVLDDLHREFGFESVLIEYRTARPGASGLDLSFRHPDWALVYWDDVSMLYLRRGGPYADVISRAEYRHVRPALSFERFLTEARAAGDKAPMAAEIEKNVRETGSSRGLLLKGMLLHAAGDHRGALQAFALVRDHMRYPLRYAADFYSGEASLALGDSAGAARYYTRVPGFEDHPHILYRLGSIALASGDAAGAAERIERAVALDPALTYAYPELIRAYEALGRTADAERLGRAAANLGERASAREHFSAGLDAYLKKDYETAGREFGLARDLDPSSPHIGTNLGYVRLDSGDHTGAATHFTEALGLDPDLAKAHYGLALALEKSGDRAGARSHFARFVELVPTGNLSREARRRIEALD